MSWLILNIGTQAENCAAINPTFCAAQSALKSAWVFLPKSQGTTSALPESKCRNPHPDFDNSPSSNQDIIDIGVFVCPTPANPGLGKAVDFANCFLLEVLASSRNCISLLLKVWNWTVNSKLLGSDICLLTKRAHLSQHGLFKDL